MAGDNFYGSQRPADLVKKFDEPYKALLAAGVTFHAALGNHDEPGTVGYPPLNMDGQRYYSFVRGNVRFFALDTNGLDDKQLGGSTIGCRRRTAKMEGLFFHHPLYSNGEQTRRRSRHSRAARADPRQPRRRRRVLRPRPRLRAIDAPEGHSLLRVGRRWSASQGAASSVRTTAASSTRTGASCWWKSPGPNSILRSVSRTGRASSIPVRFRRQRKQT